MKKPCLITFLLCLIMAASFARETTFETSYFRLILDQQGQVISLFDKNRNVEYHSGDQPSPFLRIRVSEKVLFPEKMEVHRDQLILTFSQEDIQIEIHPKEHSDYLSFEIVSISNVSKIDWVVWGPFSTTIREMVGEAVGVVRNKDFAIGIQALNVKTLGGYPDAESDIEPAYDIFETGDLVDVDASWRNKKFYRGQTAKVSENGSLLQAYSRNRNKDRIIANVGHDRFLAPAFEDGGPVGSKIALFGSPSELTLDLIGKIEIQEGLPHPLIDGEWAKKSRKATASYLILDFTAENIDRAIELTQKAGLEYLYHGGPFRNWGHFDLKKEPFPDNWKSLKAAVDRASQKGVHLGVHTLSNFISTDDPYVTPKPHPGLAKVGYSVLVKPLTRDDKVIYIESPDFFNQMENNSLQAVQIGDEIVRYRSVSSEAPWRLEGCLRGAYGTKSGAHAEGMEIGKLMDHAYQVFLGDADLSGEMAITLARLFNETGLKQVSFDGLEGTWSTGMGQYARSLFTKTWYDHLDSHLQGKVINDASNPSHFNWHINTRYNWGEPWYAGFRESQTNYRLMNQDFYQRNLLPAMLGWFSMRPETSLEDTEWLLARAAGFDAGFAFNLSFDAVEKNGKSMRIFEAIKNWEEARMAGAFTADQKSRMQDIQNEFRLVPEGTEKWTLIPYQIARLEHPHRLKQPGEPLQTSIHWENPYASRPLQFLISLVPASGESEAKASKITLTVNQFYALEIPLTLKTNQHVQLMENGDLVLYDSNWQEMEVLSGLELIPDLENGTNELSVTADFEAAPGAVVNVEIRSRGPVETVSAMDR